MALTVDITSPAAAATIEPDDALVFVVEYSGLPDDLTADVTLGDGTVERAWDYDQTTPGYEGELVVDGDERTYTIRRALGWPVGGLSLAVAVGTTGGGGDTLVYDSGVLATEREADSRFGFETFYEKTDVPFASLGTGDLRMEITLEAKRTAGSAAYLRAYVQVPGMTSESEFADGPLGASPADDVKNAVPVTSSTYSSFTMVDVFFVDGVFPGPGAARTLYFWVPHIGFSPPEAEMFFRNMQILIYSVGGGPEDDEDTRSWTVGATEGALMDQALSRVIIQYRESPKLLAFIRMLVTPLQQAFNVLEEIAELDDPDVAAGKNLTVTADLVGQGRDYGDGLVANDDQLRVLMLMRITRNSTKSTVPNLLEVLRTIFGVKVQIRDLGAMSAQYEISRAPTAEEIALLDGDIVARPMGVKVSRLWYTVDYFGFDDDPAALGFADDSAGYPGTGGGTLSEEF